MSSDSNLQTPLTDAAGAPGKTPTGGTRGATVHRLIGLDIVRGVAVLFVLAHHLWPCPATVSATLHWITTYATRGGWMGVDLFFVLSGYLVSSLLFNEIQKTGEVRVGRFLIRRAFKIYPLFWSYLAFYFLWHTARGYQPEMRVPRLLAEFFFVQNYTIAFDAHTWTLAVEEHFYILLPILVALCVRKIHRVAWVGLAIAAVCNALRFWGAREGFEMKDLFYTHYRIDELFLGALLAYARIFGGFKAIGKPRLVLAAGIAVVSIPFLIDVKFALQIAAPIAVTGALLLVSVASFYSDASSKILRFVAFIGVHSYAVYLWHMPIARFCEKFFGTGEKWMIYAPVYLITSVIFGILASRLIEIPMLRLRDRLFPSLIAPRN